MPHHDRDITVQCNDDWLLTGRMELEGHRALADQIEFIGRFAFAERPTHGIGFGTKGLSAGGVSTRA